MTDTHKKIDQNNQNLAVSAEDKKQALEHLAQLKKIDFTKQQKALFDGLKNNAEFKKIGAAITPEQKRRQNNCSSHFNHSLMRIQKKCLSSFLEWVKR